LAYATASQDYDALLFGSPLLLRNISITGKRKVARENRFVMVEPEEIRLEETLSSLGIGREQLVLMGVLVGNDFNKGVRGVGPKTALKIVKEHATLDAVQKYVLGKYAHEFPENVAAVYDFFLHPPVEQAPPRFAWNLPDENEVRRILCSEHDFSEERVGHALAEMVRQYKEKTGQSKLEKWF
jgi:flap endonuclease-1